MLAIPVIVPELTQFPILKKLVALDAKIREFVEDPAGLAYIQTNIFEKNQWRRYTPVRGRLEAATSLSELEALYNANFTNKLLFLEKREVWLDLCYQYTDFETITDVLQEYKVTQEEFERILESAASCPPTSFVRFEEVVDDRIGIVRVIVNTPYLTYENKLKRLLPLVGVEYPEDIQRDAFLRCPAFFEKIVRGNPLRFLEGIEMTGEIAGFVTSSLFLTQKNASNICREIFLQWFLSRVGMGRNLLEEAWSYYIPHCQTVESIAESLTILEKIRNKDNTLWVRSKINTLAL